jgi:hypothetical protein
LVFQFVADLNGGAHWAKQNGYTVLKNASLEKNITIKELVVINKIIR